MTDLADIVERMEGVPVLVAGDIMLDTFVYGEVSRISPEGPIPVLAVSREVVVPSGAGNVVSHLAGLNAKSHIIGVIGEDGAGKKLKALLKDLDADISGVVTDESRPT